MSEIDYKLKYEEIVEKYKKQERRLEKIIKLSDRQSKALMELNKGLEISSNTDPMTGAYNRRYFYATANKMLDIAKRQKYNMSIAMFDIDKFKNVNDTYGHDVGDIVIKDLVNTISSNIRNSDLFARFGGEEFVLLLNDTDTIKGVQLCDKLRILIKNSIPASDIRYTVSIGIADISERDENISIGLKKSDLALYEAKESGRNKVVHYNLKEEVKI